MNDPADTRPRQVTLAGWLLMVGSAFLVLLAFDRLTALHTLETRRSLEAFVSTSPGSDLGVGVETVVATIRTLAMVAAGCATAAGILGYQVLRRSRSARVAVSVLAVPIFLAGMVTGGFVSALVAAAAIMLWLPPSRSWFGDTVAAPSGPAPTARPAASLAPPVAERRPRPVVWACVLTWVFSGLAAIGLVATGVAIALDPAVLLDELHRQNPDLVAAGVTDGLALATTYVMLAGLVVWCVATTVLAVLTFRRVAWARIVHVVSAVAACGLCFVGVALGGGALLPPLVASSVTIALLLRPETRAWSERRSG